MSDRAARLPDPVLAFFAAPQLASALTVAGIGLASLTFAIRGLIGGAGLYAAMVALLLIMAASFVARFDELEWRGLLPISLLVFLGWCGLSVLWSTYQWATVGAVAYQLGFALIAVYIALSRDTIQVVRSAGDVLRVVLAVSLAAEVFSGILIDTPIPFLGIDARIAELGPISGLLATRNQLGLLALIGAVTFVIEWRTRSVGRGAATASLVVAALCIALTRSPVVMFTTTIVAIAALVAFGIRRVPAERRQYWQFSVLGAAVVGVALAWLVRDRLVELFNAGGEFDYRLALWRQVFELVSANNLEGWGWLGRWHDDLPPYIGITIGGGGVPGSALNAYADVWLQVGVVGVVAFIGMAGLAFARSWLLAGRRRSTVYVWPALVLVALLAFSLAESSILVEFGWLAFVICCVKASQELSWRNALRTNPV